MGAHPLATINRRYELLRRLGEGGQGAVFEVRDRLFPNRPTALKLIAPNAPEALLLFEFEKLAKMEHPHFAKVYDLGRTEEIEGDQVSAESALFFTQELAPGQKADKWMEAIAPEKRSAAAARVGVAVARALAALHRRGVLHGDVKPSNIVVDGGAEAPAVKLIDFGLARAAGDAARRTAGTLGYMAPEALAGYAEERSDLYALGATLLQLAKGAREDATLLEIAHRLTAPSAKNRFDTARDVALAIGRAFGAELLGEGRSGELLDAASAADDDESRLPPFRATELLGREGDLAELMAMIRNALAPSTRRPGLVFVTGPAGVGKTRLVREALVAMQIEASSLPGAAPLVISGEAAEVLEVVRLKTGRKEGDIPNPRDEVALREGVRAFDQLRGPHLCAIDDGDGDLGAALIRRLATMETSTAGTPSPLCIVAAMRDTGLARVEADSTGAALIEIGPLDEDGERALIASALRLEPSERLVRAIRERTGGLPLLTVSLVHALAEAREASPDESRLLHALAESIPKAHLEADGVAAGLSPSARRALSGLAALGSPASIGEVAETAILDAREPILEAAHVLERRGLLVHSPGDDRLLISRYAAEAVLDALDEAERRALHRRAFGVLVQRGEPDAAALARCAIGASLGEETLGWSRRAADEAIARGALPEAAPYLEAVRERLGEKSAEWERTTLELASVHRQTGAYPLAEKLLVPLVDKGTARADEARVELAAVLRLKGRPAEAFSMLRGVSKEAPLEIAIEARALEARMRIDKGELTAAKRILAEIATDDDALMVRSGALEAMGLLAWCEGAQGEARRLWTSGRDTAARLGAIVHESRFHGLLGMAAHFERRFPEAARCFARSLALADRAGDAHGAATQAVNLAAAATELGDMSEALVRYRDGMERLLKIGQRAVVVTARANHAQLLLRLGDTTGADRASRGLEEEIAKDGLSPSAAGIAMCVRADVLLALGAPEAAKERLLGAQRVLGGDTSPTARSCARHLVEASLAEGDVDAAEEALAALGSPDDAPTAEERTDRERLALEIALARGKEVASALDALLASLPEAERMPLDASALRPLLTAARAAIKTRRPELAVDLADRGEHLVERLRRATPSLHRPDSYRGLAELRALGKSPSAHGQSFDEGSIWARLARINTRLNSETRVTALLDLIMDNALEVTGGERGFLLVRDPRGELRVRCARNIDRERLAKGEQSYSRGVAERVFETREPVATTDAGADARFNEYRSVLAQNLRVIIAVPLEVQGRADGVIYVDSRAGGRFDDARLATLTAFADQAAIALTNAKLRAENARRQVRIEKLNRMLAAKLEKREEELARVKRDLERRTADLEKRRSHAGIIGSCPRMLEVYRVLDRIAFSEVPVVISGESGTGKELAAKAIHFEGPRKLAPFVAENCAAIPETLLESILFGHARGAFTGATRDARGLFVEADKGTLFLDEVGEMPLALQAKLLRVLQDGEVRPLGGTRTVRVDVRIIAATNRDLSKLVKEKKFRDDLYYRLHVMELNMPKLAERKGDIPELVDHFLDKHAKGRSVRVEAAALEALTAFDWPGNVRQLENEIVRALVLCEDRLGTEHLSETVSQSSFSGSFADFTDLTMERHLDLLQKKLVRAALDRARGNRTKAAAFLGVSRFGLQKMLTRLGI